MTAKTETEQLKVWKERDREADSTKRKRPSGGTTEERQKEEEDYANMWSKVTEMIENRSSERRRWKVVSDNWGENRN